MTSRRNFLGLLLSLGALAGSAKASQANRPAKAPKRLRVHKGWILREDDPVAIRDDFSGSL